MSDKTILVYPKGSVIQFTDGEYSDFRTCGLVVTVEDCDLPKLAKKYSKAHKPQWQGDRASPGEFATWLVTKGLALPVNVEEVHLGSYGEFDKQFIGADE